MGQSSLAAGKLAWEVNVKIKSSSHAGIPQWEGVAVRGEGRGSVDPEPGITFQTVA